MEQNSKDMQKKIFSVEFHKFCRKNFSEQMQKLEKERKKYYFYCVVAITFCILLSMFFLYLSFIIDEYSSNPDTRKALLVMAIFPLAFSLFTTLIAKEYKKKAKKILLEKLLSYIGPFKLTDDRRNIEYIKTLKLFSRFNNYTVDDRIFGRYGSLVIDITELDLTYVTKRDGKTKSSLVFKGVLITIPSHKKYEGSTIIRNLYENPFFDVYGLERVTLEDPEFEKLFKVHSDSQIESRYLITAAFMNRMVELYKQGQKISLSFEQGNINIAITTAKDWFEIPFLKPATDSSIYKDIVGDLLAILKMVDDLKLDQNIGM